MNADEENNGLSEEENKELERNYRAARSYVSLSHETLKLFGYVSEGASELMVHATLVHRIAEMSNFFLNMLVGSKRKSLRIKGNY